VEAWRSAYVLRSYREALRVKRLAEGKPAAVVAAPEYLSLVTLREN
jgi:hypothetical protein